MVSPELEQAATAAVLLSMITAPFILGSSDAIIGRFVKSGPGHESLGLALPMLVETMSKSEHVLIIGFDAAANRLPAYWRKKASPYFALDLLDIARVQVARNAGELVSFGDAKRREVLKPPALGRAKMVVITLNRCTRPNMLGGNIMSMHPSMPVYVRATNDDYVKTFTEMGADEAAHEKTETKTAVPSLSR